MKKFLYIIIIFSISFYLSIEFIGDRLIKNKLEENISNALNREVSIDKLNIKYLSGEADIFGIRLLNKNFEGELARIDTVKLNLDTLSLYSNNIIINNVLVDMVDFPGYSYHSGIVFSIFQPKTGVPLINGGQYKTPFSKKNKKERKGMGFDIDLISILKLQSK